MDYRYIKAFLSTAKFLSFSKAAKELQVAQSAISRQIKLLEESLGSALIIRSSKKVLLTQKGRDLYKAAQNFDHITQNIFNKEDNHPLKIGILQGLLENWLTPILAKYLKKQNRNIYIRVDTQENLNKGIENGEYDLLFSIQNLQSELITSLKLFNERLVLISKEPVNLKKLENYRWIMYDETDALTHIGVKKSSQIICIASMSSIMSLVKSNVGIAIIPDHMVKKTDKMIVTYLPTIKNSQVYMTSLNYKKLPNHIEELVQIIKKNIN